MVKAGHITAVMMMKRVEFDPSLGIVSKPYGVSTSQGTGEQPGMLRAERVLKSLRVYGDSVLGWAGH